MKFFLKKSNSYKYGWKLFNLPFLVFLKIKLTIKLGLSYLAAIFCEDCWPHF
ncbi:hypothetical protein GLOIN_2v1581823 [Rhizophagus irregularis DAOM 181602=DAOM 197198]|uniref:Uncharacterized protein n=1 Tax=Rhizophagus irregularis (strain DAOM 181602 / DAOM 197198 / MUCL 43194) TaxID=747089 RepID=A0A2P4Q8A4_RHIID|nr:hypothetical protein GLOIN_2v1581823 [Rhizophagus irregularis DAOM 181602=DAOM 197198]POG73864.1 hypothetical protein GLOIN_2v1581823 [Rhizophagus irregularis DAOM 181602=DAOM 197198]|eukprot:XP_025180730.1 hypothetical protein GLOIN_2v1581823 [Rhizophagus irregularis DAOM 181602=DAOM 197198]